MLNNSIVLVTGGTGSLGRALVAHIFANHKPKKVIVLSRDEFKQWQMQQDFSDERGYGRLRFFIGDVRDPQRLHRAFDGVDFVIHAAALKQIPALEYNPSEAVKTNVNGTLNVVNACVDKGVKRAVLISTDKAVNPINLYGATKLCAEKLFLAANAYDRTRFAAVRYGNVIASRGSVIEKFLSLKEKGVKEFPITDKNMTRFWITLDEAVELVMLALHNENKGVFVPNIPSMLMTDLARAIEPDCSFKFIGIRPGEKLHESLISLSENAWHTKWGGYLVSDNFKGEPVGCAYTSKNNDRWMTADELRRKLNGKEIACPVK